MRIKQISLSLLAALAVGCGSGTNEPGQTLQEPSGTISVSLTDAPIDDAASVFVTVKGLSVRYQDENWVDYDLDSPMKIDLLTLQQGRSVNLLADADVRAGSYQLRLRLYEDDDNVPDNSIVLQDGGQEYRLTVPSGLQSGLKLDSPIVVPVNGSADYTIDFDVRRSVVRRGRGNDYLLKPVLRLVDNVVSGTISGTFTDVTPLMENCSDQDPLSHNVIYVYAGHDILPDDIGSTGEEPVASAGLAYNETSGEYSYTVAYLPAGDYTVSFSCHADSEDTEADDDLRFKLTRNETVVPGAAEPAQPGDETTPDGPDSGTGSSTDTIEEQESAAGSGPAPGPESESTDVPGLTDVPAAPDQAGLGSRR